MNSRELNVVQPCPKWCTEDHTVQAGEDRNYHSGDTHELTLPDGRVALEATLVHEATDAGPALAVALGDLTALLNDVDLLDADGAQAFNARVQQFAAHVNRMAATVRKGAPTPPSSPRKKKRQLPPSLQHASKETRLYLAERDGRCCFYCRTEFDDMREATADHYVPRSVWECNMPANLVLACEPCNRAKDDRLTWSMAAVLLAWAAREGGSAGAGNGAQGPVGAPPARASLASLAA